MLFDLITLGGWLFWSITALFVLILIGEIHSSHVKSALLTVAIYVAMLVLFTTATTAPAITFLYHNPWYIVAGFAGYIVLGSIWSVAKWYFFLVDKRREYDEGRARFLVHKDLTEFPTDPKIIKEWNDSRHSFGVYGNFPPRVRSNKAAITTWMAFWPFSFAGTVFGDLILNVCETVYQNLSGLMQRMSNSVFKGYEELN